jgi:hypothetical protein
VSGGENARCYRARIKPQRPSLPSAAFTVELAYNNRFHPATPISQRPTTYSQMISGPPASVIVDVVS